MKSWKYYIQLPLLPIHYFVTLGKLVYADTKLAYTETKIVYLSHRRHYS